MSWPCVQWHSWAAQYHTWLLIKLTPKGVGFFLTFLQWHIYWQLGSKGCDVNFPQARACMDGDALCVLAAQLYRPYIAIYAIYVLDVSVKDDLHLTVHN